MFSLETFFQSILIGISIAAIPGPIFFELTRRTLAHGFWSGALVSVGDFLGNLLLLSLIFFGVSQFLTYTITKSVLYICGGIILFYLSYLAFKLKAVNIEQSYEKMDDHKGSILAGLLIAITSPIVIAFWISLSGSYLAKFDSAYSAILAILTIVLGFVSFFFCLAGIVHVTRKRIPTRYVVWLSRIFGIILFFYGLYFMYELAALLKLY